MSDELDEQMDSFRIDEAEEEDDDMGDAEMLDRTPGPTRPSAMDREAREEAQRAELSGLRQVNEVLSAVNNTIVKAERNMETVSEGVQNANKLLDVWIRILSQAEHTQKLLQSETWEGINKDLADVEEDERQRRLEIERRQEEARRRAEEREREAAAAEARRAVAEKKPARGIRKGVVPTTRGSSSLGASRGRGIPAPSSRGGIPTARGSGIARGIGRGVARGRGATK